MRNRIHASAVAEAKPLVAIAVGGSAERSAKAVRALRLVLKCAPKGAVLATDGRRYGIFPHLDKGWREVQP